jgi:hypothetical protein
MVSFPSQRVNGSVGDGEVEIIYTNSSVYSGFISAVCLYTQLDVPCRFHDYIHLFHFISMDEA